jgi:nucleotide-binding universal stress UspA family protein
MAWLRAAHAPPAAPSSPGSVLLASEGRPLSAAAIETASRLALAAGVPVHVLSIARVWGTSLGLPNPALLPSKREWDEQRSRVETAIAGLKDRGVTGHGRVVGTRQAGKRILGEAAALGCSAIVMAADRPRHWLIADLLWSQEPYRVRRRSPIPVHLVTAAD